MKEVYFKLNLNFQIILIRMEIRQQKAVYGKIQHLYSLNKITGIEQWYSKYPILTFCINSRRHLYVPLYLSQSHFHVDYAKFLVF